MWNQGFVVNWAQPDEESYQARLNQPPIQFSLCPESPIENLYSNSSSSHIGQDEGNAIEIGIYDFLWDTHPMAEMLLDSF